MNLGWANIEQSRVYNTSSDTTRLYTIDQHLEYTGLEIKDGVCR